MHRLFSIDFWVQAFVSTFITMLMFYILKQMNEKVKIPVVSTIIEEA